MRTSYPEHIVDAGNARSFRQVVVDQTQQEFMRISRAKDETPQDYMVRMESEKKRSLALIKFIAHLFLRKMIATKVVHTIIRDLLTDNPSETCLEQVICFL